MPKKEFDSFPDIKHSNIDEFSLICRNSLNQIHTQLNICSFEKFKLKFKTSIKEHLDLNTPEIHLLYPN